jgi:hypothetical protein
MGLTKSHRMDPNTGGGYPDSFIDPHTFSESLKISMKCLKHGLYFEKYSIDTCLFFEYNQSRHYSHVGA